MLSLGAFSRHITLGGGDLMIFIQYQIVKRTKTILWPTYKNDTFVFIVCE